MRKQRKAHYHTLEYELVERLFAERFRGLRVLDIGCGLGEYLSLFGKYGCEATGMDINPEQVKNLAAKGYDARLPENMPDGSMYDVLFMSHVIEHMPPAEMVAHFRKWLPRLKADGRPVVITPLDGHRFWHDFTHVRPYYPQSLWMLWGGWNRPASDKLEWTLELEDIFFFNDPFRIRHGAILGRAYYLPPDRANRLASGLTKFVNGLLEYSWRMSRGKIGACASWLGIYKFGT